MQDQSSHWLTVRQGFRLIGTRGKPKRTCTNFTSIVTSLNDNSNNINIRVSKTPNHITQDTADYISGGSRPSHKGRPGHPDPEIMRWGGGGRSQKSLFAAFRASVWSKNKRRPPLDPPLKSNMIYTRIRTDPVCQFSNLRVSPEQTSVYTAPTPSRVYLGRKVLPVPT